MKILYFIICGIILIFIWKRWNKYLINNVECIKYKTMDDCLKDVNCVPCLKKNKCLNIKQYNNSFNACSNLPGQVDTNKFKKYKKIKLIGKPLRKNCYSICNSDEFCLKFEKDLKHFIDCEKCHKEGKCYKIGNSNMGTCANCIVGEKQYRCNNTRYIGCPRVDDINNFNGIKPYFILNDSNNISDIYGTKCSLCK